MIPFYKFFQDAFNVGNLSNDSLRNNGQVDDVWWIKLTQHQLIFPLCLVASSTLNLNSVLLRFSFHSYCFLSQLHSCEFLALWITLIIFFYLLRAASLHCILCFCYFFYLPARYGKHYDSPTVLVATDSLDCLVGWLAASSSLSSSSALLWLLLQSVSAMCCILSSILFSSLHSTDSKVVVDYSFSFLFLV